MNKERSRGSRLPCLTSTPQRDIAVASATARYTHNRSKFSIVWRVSRLRLQRASQHNSTCQYVHISTEKPAAYHRYLTLSNALIVIRGLTISLPRPNTHTRTHTLCVENNKYKTPAAFSGKRQLPWSHNN
ncbi:hypothetical protein N7497_011091 [Penicillium chrysogenum]|jgi:hypothetical protein|nr:hypothetical protein N7497_011091 [Penicillium chrysogenum]